MLTGVGLRTDELNLWEMAEDVSHGRVIDVPPWLEQAEFADGLRADRPAASRAKRAFDIVSAIGLLVVALPILLFAIVAVRLSSPGPAIYTQIRTGVNARKRRDRRRANQGPPVGTADRRAPGRDRRARNAFGRPFTMYKLRTMALDAERDGPQLAQENDPRVTRVGRFLRKTRIDELPQLYNVLRGDMSLVGPRPERPEFIARLNEEIPNYIDRLGVKPGITGLAQVVNGYDEDLNSFRRKVAYDLLYLQNQSVRNDLRIMWRTVRVVLTGKGAR